MTTAVVDRRAFVARFGALYEHSPWVAERAFEAGIGPRQQDDRRALHAALVEAVESAPRERQLALIRAHPDLADRAAIAGELTAHSRHEQASAGLDACSPTEFERFRSLNSAYRERFGFPFVIAVKGLDRAAILAAFERRLGQDRESEIREALDQIHRIAWLRLEAL